MPRRIALVVRPTRDRADKLTLVTFSATGRGLTGLRERQLVFDSPRVLARDERDTRLS